MRSPKLCVWVALVTAAFVHQVRADTDIESFVDRCDVYRDIGSPRDFVSRAMKQRREMSENGAPISLQFDSCGSMNFLVRLMSGRIVKIESGYGTNRDPDFKGTRYEWNPSSPSDRFWLFNFYEWELSGWLLVDKRTGKQIQTFNECGDSPIIVEQEFVATVCTGAYDNRLPTLYIADTGSPTPRWTEAIALSTCPEQDEFVLESFRFNNRTTLEIEGACIPTKNSSKSRGSATLAMSRRFHVSKSGVSMKVGKRTISVNWK